MLPDSRRKKKSLFWNFPKQAFKLAGLFTMRTPVGLFLLFEISITTLLLLFYEKQKTKPHENDRKTAISCGIMGFTDGKTG
jgi:hypothetical protein